jgi:hypothetical protein
VKNILKNVVDEGASNCVMSMSFWRAIGCLDIVQSNTMLKEFDGHTFSPHGIIFAFFCGVRWKECLNRS